MIRFRTLFSARRRRGLSLVELIYVLFVIGIVLGVVWIKAGIVFHNVEIDKAIEQLRVLVVGLRQLHPYDKVTEDENIDLLNLPPDMVMHFKNRAVLVNPWHGQVIIYPGNAGGWGGDTHNDEVTLRYDGVPGGDCTDLVMKAFQQTRDFGLVAVYISPKLAEGKEICFSSDLYCRTIVTKLVESEIDALCKARSTMTVMFTYNAH
jgi:hypothetical protein